MTDGDTVGAATGEGLGPTTDVEDVAGTTVQSHSNPFATRQKRLIDPSEFLSRNTIELAGTSHVCESTLVMPLLGFGNGLLSE